MKNSSNNQKNCESDKAHQLTVNESLQRDMQAISMDMAAISQDFIYAAQKVLSQIETNEQNQSSTEAAARQCR